MRNYYVSACVMQIQAMTISELVTRFEIGMVTMDHFQQLDLLKYASEAEIELEYFEELKECAEDLKETIKMLEMDLKLSESESEKQEDKIYKLRSIIESALDMIKNPNLYEEDVDQLIELLKEGLK